MPAHTSASSVLSSLVAIPARKSLATSVPAQGTSALNECPAPTGRSAPGVLARMSSSCASLSGAARPLGTQAWLPAQLRHGSGVPGAKSGASLSKGSAAARGGA